MSTVIDAPPASDATTSNPTQQIPSRMKAAVYTAYGPPEVIEIQDVDTPAPGDHQVLIKVRAAALNPLDWRIMRGGSLPFRLLFGWTKPKARPGRDVAGEVVSVGRMVTRWNAGDRVFGGCMGALAQYACAGETKIARIPESMSFEQAASIPVAGMTALQGLRDYGVRAGSKVLINGAAGGVGTFAVQIAKWLGAEVTGVCSTNKVEMVRSLGADHVIDYTREEFTGGVERYDVILDNVGNLPPAVFKRVLVRGGKVVMAGAPKDAAKVFPRMLNAILLNAIQLSMSGRRIFHAMIARIGTKDLTVVAELIEAGKVKPILERTYALDEVRDPMRYLETGPVMGKLIIKLA